MSTTPHAQPAAPLKGRRLRVATLNVHGFSAIDRLARAVAAHGPFDVLAIQEGGEAEAQYAEFADLLGMKLAVKRSADFSFVNALFVAEARMDVQYVHEWDLRCVHSSEKRSAVAVVVQLGGGGLKNGAQSASLTTTTTSGVHGRVSTTSLAKTRRYCWISSARSRRCADNVQQYRLGAAPLV